MSEFDNQRWLPPFKAHLIKQGFKPSTIKRYLSVCQGFLDYLQREGIAVEQVNPPILNVYLQLQVQRYRQRHGHLPRDIRTARHLFDRGITPLLRFVQGRWPPSSQPATRLDRFRQRLCNDYADWLADSRGLSARTIKTHRCYGLQFLTWLGNRAAPEHLAELTIEDIDAYFEAKASCYRRATRANIAFCLRDFLRYLYTQKLIARDLAAAVTSPTVYAMERLPSALKPDDIDTVLDLAKQNRAPVGIRNYAILSLLAHYGLRAGEIVQLRLDDIDWRHDHLHIRQSKLHTEAVLPLLTPVGNALLDYLQNGRPPTAAREVFVRALAPHQPFRTGSSLYGVVARLLTRVGIQAEGRRGPHTFRHARAVSLLRDAVPLTAVSDILGHRSTAHTRIYLKLATEDLRDVALDVPAPEEVAL